MITLSQTLLPIDKPLIDIWPVKRLLFKVQKTSLS